MKREDLTKLGLTDDAVIDGIMKLHGSDIEGHKTKITELQGQFDNVTAQLTEANKAIESFKAMKPDELKAAADDYKAKWEQAQTDAANNLQKVKFDHALESALSGAKAKDVKSVIPHLDITVMKLQEDGSISGLTEQLAKVQKEKDFLFESASPPPRIITGGGNQSVVGNMSALEAAARRGGHFTTEPKQGS